MVVEGRLYSKDLDGVLHWVLDAEPFVVSLFNRLFTRSLVCDLAGVFTHRPRMLRDSLITRRDLDWFRGRFDLTISSADLELLIYGTIKRKKNVASLDRAFSLTTVSNLSLSLPLRDYQSQVVNLGLARGSLLLADQVGLGKTPVGVAFSSFNLPALIVVPPTLVTQWEYEIKKFIPDACVHKIYGRTVYDLPAADFYVTAYSRIAWWADSFVSKNISIGTLILDECHELRRSESKKYEGVRMISSLVPFRMGLSATPIMNYGVEICNVMDILDPTVIPDRSEFVREWTKHGSIRDPVAFGSWLRRQNALVRRTRKDVGLSLEPVNRIVYNIEADRESLEALEEEASLLALKVVTGDFHTAGEASLDFDWRLRQATGVAKAKSVASTVRLILDSEEKVVLFGWHRDVYDIWLNELKDLNPVLYTGSETPKQKLDNFDSFVNGDSRILIMSLRSGAGLNGLQSVCSHVVFGELDWSNGIMDQCIGRLWRDGQDDQVNAIFITIEDGSDPMMVETIGLKAAEAGKIINPTSDKFIAPAYSDKKRVSEMARDYLRKRGHDVLDTSFVKLKEDSTEAHTCSILDDLTLDVQEEDVMQKQIYEALNDVFSVEREKRISKKSRLDFLIEDNIIVECKVKGSSRTDMLRQIKRYKKEFPVVKCIILVAPYKLKTFEIDGVPVYSVNAAKNSLLIEGLS